MANRRKVEKYQQKHRSLGLCIRCSRPAFNGSTLCLVHSRNNNLRRKNHRLQGICIFCSKPAMPDRAYCYYHYVTSLLSVKKYRNINRDKMNEKSRIKRIKYKSEGRCIECGIKLIEDETYRCTNCKIKRQHGSIYGLMSKFKLQKGGINATNND
jgi:hypothetical protein